MGITINYGMGSYEEMSRQAADIVAGAVKAKNDAALGLPTGSSPIGMYARLIEMNKAGDVDFSRVATFNLDEYYPIKKDSPQSYYKFMFDNFFNGINIGPGNINIPNGEAADPGRECLEYEQKINKAGGIDLMVLGIGANGHIGFNEPGEYLVPHTHVAELTAATIEANARFFCSAGEVPVKALTMGMGSIIAKSKKILMLVSGESKRGAFKKFCDGGRISADNPASFLYLHNDVTVLSDLDI